MCRLSFDNAIRLALQNRECNASSLFGFVQLHLRAPSHTSLVLAYALFRFFILNWQAVRLQSTSVNGD